MLSKYISTVKYLCNIIITGHLYSREVGVIMGRGGGGEVKEGKRKCLLPPS